jgi:signal transduction histidine kinase
VAVAGAVAAAATLNGVVHYGSLGPVPAYLLIGAGAGALLVRRRWPLAVLAVNMAATGIWFGLGYIIPGSSGYLGSHVIELALLIALYTAASQGQRRRNLVLGTGLVVMTVLLTTVIALLAGPRFHGFSDVLIAAGILAWLEIPLLLGELARSRREYLAMVVATTRDRALREERLRIARELHDVVAHGIAMINVQAGVAAHVIDRQPDEARQALLTIKQASGEALRELRATLGVLRRDDEPRDAPRQPEPGLARLDALVAATRSAGLDVRLEVAGAPRPLPAATDLVAYRIVQEALTNVLRHTAARRVTVSLAYEPGELRVEVTDDGRGTAAAAVAGEGSPGGDGHGIAGMRERALAVGGRLEAGPAPGGGFRVAGCLPLADAGVQAEAGR